jgi:hypothetical protein
MMIFSWKNLSFALVLSSSAAARGMRRLQDQTLGAAFLEAVAEAPTDSPSLVYNRDGSFSADIKGESMTPLSEAITEICTRLGRIEHYNSYSDGHTGEPQNLGLTCRFERNGTYDEAYQEFSDVITEAEPISTSFSSNVYSNYYGTNMMGQQTGLEMLIQMAETIEEVMLVVPAWQNVMMNHSPHTESSSINININKYHDYGYSPDKNYTGYDDDMFMPPPPLEESGDLGNNNNNNSDGPYGQ